MLARVTETAPGPKCSKFGPKKRRLRMGCLSGARAHSVPPLRTDRIQTNKSHGRRAAMRRSPRDGSRHLRADLAHYGGCVELGKKMHPKLWKVNSRSVKPHDSSGMKGAGSSPEGGHTKNEPGCIEADFYKQIFTV